MKLDLDTAFLKVGSFGKFQKRLFLLTGLVWFPCAWQTLLMVFVHQNPEIQCTRVDDTECLQALQHDTYCSLPRSSWEIVGHRGENGQRIVETLAEEWDLLCERQWMVGTLGSLFFLGFLLGAGLGGFLSDRYGRRRSFFIAVVVFQISATASAFAPSYEVYAFWRILIGTSTGAWGLVGFCLCTEYLGADYRSFLGCLFNVFFAFGVAVLSPIAYYLRDWRDLTLWTCLPGFLFFFFLRWLPESPRWLLVKGRVQETVQCMRRVAAVNGQSWDSAWVLVEPVSLGVGKELRQYGFSDLFSTKYMRTVTLVMLYSWFASSFTYYGLSLSSGNIGSSLYVSNFLSGIVEIPAYIIIARVLDTHGRRWSLRTSMAVAAGACLGVAIIGGSVGEGGVTVMAMVGKFGISGAFAVVYVYSAELFPTVVRNLGIGVCSQAARIGGIIAPLVVTGGGGDGSPTFSMLVFGLAALGCTGLTRFVPETLNQPLPEDLPEDDEGIEMGERERQRGGGDLESGTASGTTSSRSSTSDVPLRSRHKHPYSALPSAPSGDAISDEE